MLIFIYGENAFLAAGHLAQMKSRFVEKFDTSGMNLVEFQGKYTLGEVLQAVASPPFLSEKRMVIVHDLLSTVTRKPDYEPWIEGLSKTQDSTIVILKDSTTVKKTQAHGLFKALNGQPECHTYPFGELSGGQLTAWAQQYVKEIGLAISPALLQRVVGLIGSDVWQISLELDKLAAYSVSNEVDESVVRELVHANFEDQMFDFIDAVSGGNSSHALSLLEQQRGAGSTDFHLFAMLARQIRLLLGAADLVARDPSATKQQLASALKVHPFVAQKTLAQARRMDLDALREQQAMVFDFDRKMKRGGIDARIAVDRLVSEMLMSQTPR